MLLSRNASGILGSARSRRTWQGLLWSPSNVHQEFRKGRGGRLDLKWDVTTLSLQAELLCLVSVVQFGSAGKNLLYLILFLLTCTLRPSLHFASL